MSNFNIYLFIAVLTNDVTLNWDEIGSGAVAFAIVVAISFAMLLLIESALRFHHIVLEKSGADKNDPADTFRVSMIRRIMKLQNNPPPFCLVLVSARLLQEEKDDAFGALDTTALLEKFRSFLRESDDCALHENGKLALLIETGRRSMGIIVERLNRNIGAMKFRDDAGIPQKLDLRMGAAFFPEAGTRAAALFEQAEAALKTAEASVGPGTWVFDKPLLESAEEEDAPQDKGGATPSFIDPLTGLLKAARSKAMVQKFVAQCRREEGHVSVLFLRIEDLERHSKYYGEEVVKTVRREMSRFLQKELRKNDIIGCWEEDAFIVALAGDAECAETIARRLTKASRKMKIAHESYRLRLSVCIGFASLPEHGSTPRHILRAGQIALHAASEKGHNVSVCFNPDMLTSKRVKEDQGQDVF